jgi:hypothetical protein
MRKLLAFTFLLGIFACKKEPKPIVPPEPIAVEAPVSHECYLGVLGKDTITMNLELRGSEITSGQLRYNFFEKDDNDGELTGLIVGDTLKAAYTFMSEGAATVREVVFLKKGKNYVEGYGEVIDDSQGNVSFKDIKKLKFDSKIVLVKTYCEDL